MKLFRRPLKAFRKIKEKIDRAQVEIALAEAGESLNQEKATAHEELENPGKLLVIGRLTKFPEDLIDYSIDMAKRFNYEIIALNTSPIGHHGIFNNSKEIKQQQKEFLELSRKGVEKFRKTAEKNNINFGHEVKFCREEEAIDQLYKEHNDIHFVISKHPAEIIHESQDNRLSKEIYVYSVT